MAGVEHMKRTAEEGGDTEFFEARSVMAEQRKRKREEEKNKKYRV